MNASLYLGTSGFSYPYWKGRFYPKGLKGAEQLSFYARRFTTVEINSTYYGIPPVSVFERMTEQAPPPFLFTVKAFGGMTHDAGVDEGMCRQFVDALAPLQAGDQLATILLQFPNAFRPNTDALDKLKRLAEVLDVAPLVVEFRHRDWHRAEHIAAVRALGMGWCCVDEPALPGLLPGLTLATGEVGYVRFHGRNQGSWYGNDRDQRYNYLYQKRELLEWSAGLVHLASVTKRLFVFMNNCYLGHAARNAALLQDIMDQLAGGGDGG